MAKNKYHDLVKQALIDEGWTITDDPLKLKAGNREVEVDLGAEKLFAAKKGLEEIAVEVKTFSGISALHDFYKAMGQFKFYQLAMEEKMPEKTLYLAIPSDIYKSFFLERFVQHVVSQMTIRIITYNVKTKKIEQWIKDFNTKK